MLLHYEDQSVNDVWGKLCIVESRAGHVTPLCGENC